jgi:DNA-binding NarL/FixJ family response regulator
MMICAGDEGVTDTLLLLALRDTEDDIDEAARAELRADAGAGYMSEVDRDELLKALETLLSGREKPAKELEEEVLSEA